MTVKSKKRTKPHHQIIAFLNLVDRLSSLPRLIPCTSYLVLLVPRTSSITTKGEPHLPLPPCIYLQITIDSRELHYAAEYVRSGGAAAVAVVVCCMLASAHLRPASSAAVAAAGNSSCSRQAAAQHQQQPQAAAAEQQSVWCVWAGGLRSFPDKHIQFITRVIDHCFICVYDLGRKTPFTLFCSIFLTLSSCFHNDHSNDHRASLDITITQSRLIRYNEDRGKREARCKRQGTNRK